MIPVLTIDGPSGSGKGTVSIRCAEALGWRFLDSGALYRLLGYHALMRGIDLDDDAALAAAADELDIAFDFKSQGPDSVRLNGEAVGDAIRTEAVASAASRVAAQPPVREALLDLQRRMRAAPGLVADGRDMGTVVFPDAPVKVFLTASAEERAERRLKQLNEQGISVKFPALLAEIRERDARDRNRAVAPLKPADDALVLDSTAMGIDEVVDRVLAEVRNAGLG